MHPCMLAGLAPAPVHAAALLPSQTHAHAAGAVAVVAAGAGAGAAPQLAVMMHEPGLPAAQIGLRCDEQLVQQVMYAAAL
jgi:hypothetical protein